jgi:hypothetical protein
MEARINGWAMLNRKPAVIEHLSDARIPTRRIARPS